MSYQNNTTAVHCMSETEEKKAQQPASIYRRLPLVPYIYRWLRCISVQYALQLLEGSAGCRQEVELLPRHTSSTGSATATGGGIRNIRHCSSSLINNNLISHINSSTSSTTSSSGSVGGKWGAGCRHQHSRLVPRIQTRYDRFIASSSHTSYEPWLFYYNCTISS